MDQTCPRIVNLQNDAQLLEGGGGGGHLRITGEKGWRVVCAGLPGLDLGIDRIGFIEPSGV